MTGTTHLACVQHCPHQPVHAALGKASPFLTLSPKPIIIPINPLHLQAWVKRISKLILPCLEVQFGDLVTFQPCGHFQSGMTSRCSPASRQHKGKLPKHRGHCATWQSPVEQLCWCQTARLQLTQPHRHCSPGEQLQLWLHNSILQPSALVQVACYLWHTHSYWFHESGIHAATGKCCKALTHLEEYIHVLTTFLVLHVNLLTQ